MELRARAAVCGLVQVSGATSFACVCGRESVSSCSEAGTGESVIRELMEVNHLLVVEVTRLFEEWVLL